MGALRRRHSASAVVNYAIYIVCLTVLPASILRPFMAVAAGSLSGLVFNFTLSHAFVFRGGAGGASLEVAPQPAPGEGEASGQDMNRPGRQPSSSVAERASDTLELL